MLNSPLKFSIFPSESKDSSSNANVLIFRHKSIKHLGKHYLTPNIVLDIQFIKIFIYLIDCEKERENRNRYI